MMLRDFYRLEDLGLNQEVKSKLNKLLDEDVYRFVENNIKFDDKTVILDTDSVFSVEIIPKRVNSILNFRLVNNFRWINKYFESINAKLNKGGLFLGCVETYSQRRQRILNRFNPFISYPMYFLDFIVKRVLPKLKITGKIFHSPARCEERAISRVETYGRLYASGFELVCEKKINNILFFIFKKTDTPKYEAEKHCGMVIKLKRIGKNGKEMEVKKLRTMYAYSEYLQSFIYKRNLLETGGKF
ncbi:MAG: hypothetical protein JW917_08715, partial [Ignavibacteria bacterium]|nr:hypothetical protein [Ignavibacteria bacterium]